jgi:hypothetical protein
MSIIKNFIVKKNHTLLPNNFIINTGKKFIHVISAYLHIFNSIFSSINGYTLHSNINHDYYENTDDNYTCYVSELFLPKIFSFKDFQQYYIDFTIKDPNSATVNLDEIIDKNSGLTIDIPVEQFDPLLHRWRYQVRIELKLEVLQE